MTAITLCCVGGEPRNTTMMAMRSAVGGVRHGRARRAIRPCASSSNPSGVGPSARSTPDQGSPPAYGVPSSAEAAAAFEIAPFLKWVASNGYKGNGLSFATGDFDWERGLLANTDVPKEQPLLVVPYSMAITDDEALLDPAPKTKRTLNWGGVLAVRLLQERARNDESKWAQYLPSLPAHIPALWWLAATESPLLREAQYPTVVKQASLMAADVCRTYDKLDVEVLAGASLEEFLWAVAVVHSRSFGVEQLRGNNKVLNHLLLPLADMLNHGGDELTCYWTTEQAKGSPSQTDVQTCTTNVEWVTKSAAPDTLFFVATKNIARGTEALLSYGDRSNDHFALYYGFTPKNNPYDDVVLFDDMDALIEWYRPLALAANDGCNEANWEERVCAAKDAYASEVRNLMLAGEGELSAAEPRLKMLTGSKLDVRLMAALPELVRGPTSLDWDAETKLFWEVVCTRCSELLTDMPTTLQQDLALLLCDTTDGAADGQPHWRELWRQLDVEQGWCGAEPEAALGASSTALAIRSYEHRMLVEFRAYKKLMLTRALVMFSRDSQKSSQAMAQT